MTRSSPRDTPADLRRRINLMGEELRQLETERDRYAQALRRIAG
jgi:hypothetical protein